MEGHDMRGDEELVTRIRQGDLTATDELYDRYKDRLYRFIGGYVSSAQDAEEVFHDAFMAALKDRSAVFEAGSFAPWLFRVARNRALNHRRGAMRYQKTLVAVEHDTSTAGVMGESSPMPEDEVERRQAVIKAVDRLPESLREMFQLRSSGLSYEDMARVLDVPLGTVKSRIHQMVSALRKDMASWIAR
jgi:RNA polymerase sigma-70 factor, ECF subfamily